MSVQQTYGSAEDPGQGGAYRAPRRRGADPWMDHVMAAEAWERQHEAEWVRVDRKLRVIAARRAALDAEEAHLLRYADELKLWRAYGFGSLAEYMERAMGYAPHTAAERIRVARALAELPLIAEALEQGGLAHSAVRELSRVAVPDTEDAWLEAARGKNLREIEAMVSGHRPGHLPTDKTEPRLHRKRITLEISPETYDLWRKMHALAAEEHGQRLSDDELIASIFRRAYGDAGGSGGSAAGAAGGSGGSAAGAASAGAGRSGKAAGTPAYKIAIKQCPDCKRAWQFSGGRDIEVDPRVVECAACDAIHLGSLDATTPERITTTVTARKREHVLARDGYSCTVPGCRRNTGLDLHHIAYQSCGGGHELSNLTTICDLHHRAVHFGKIVIRGTAPDHVIFEFRKPRDRRNITDDDVPTPPSPPASDAAALSAAAPSAVAPSAAAPSAAAPSAAAPDAAAPSAAAPSAAAPNAAAPSAAAPDAAAPDAAAPSAVAPSAAAPSAAAPSEGDGPPSAQSDGSASVGPTWTTGARRPHGAVDPPTLGITGESRRSSRPRPAERPT